MKVRLPAAPVILLVLGLSAGLSGCPDESTDTTYAGSARRNYQMGMEALEDADYLEAIRLFNFVKNKYAYSKYAALAELRIADTYFQQEKLVEAIDAYRTFLQAHPNHRDVAFAMWRIALSYNERMPSDFFLFPPCHEKDQGPTKDALRALKRYVDRFPNDEHVPMARQRIAEARGLLADYELYVARFYLRQQRPASARGRLEFLMESYADLPDRWATAVLQLARVYHQLDMNDEALKTVRRLVEKRPESSEAEEARQLTEQWSRPPG